jgi:hypothetical protein
VGAALGCSARMSKYGLAASLTGPGRLNAPAVAGSATIVMPIAMAIRASLGGGLVNRAKVNRRVGSVRRRVPGE